MIILLEYKKILLKHQLKIKSAYTDQIKKDCPIYYRQQYIQLVPTTLR